MGLTPIVDHSKMKLGVRGFKTDSRTLRLARYMTAALPPAPDSLDWTKGVSDFGMMLNDKLGCCTIAGCAHAVQIWTLNAGSEVTLSDQDVLDAYCEWDGYVDGDPATDQGGVELDVLIDWKAGGFAGHALTGFADPNVANLDEVRQAIMLFGGVYIGLALPLSAQTQEVWEAVDDPGDGSTDAGSWGGHCVFVPKYDAGDSLSCITWGMVKQMTEAFWRKYCLEAHALLSPDWIAAQGAPNGFNLAQLEADLALVC
jgi:hypothetical protein